MIPLKVANLAAFFILSVQVCVLSQRTRTCTDCRNEQELGPITD